MWSKRKLLRLGKLELIAFIIGFCLLTYELVAARLLAPHIGSSVYVWTSVIGIIILALSLGYAFGGWLADKRVNTLDVSYLLLASAACVATTLLLYPPILSVMVALVPDPRMQGFLSSLTLFAPTSFVLGSISPYLVRLSVQTIKTSGRVVASLSAVNSVGGITGTFVTGFLLFGYLGSNQILVMIVAILLAASWVVIPRQQSVERLVITLAVIGCTVVGFTPHLSSSVVADIDTASARYLVTNVNVAESKPYRALITGPGGRQSGALTNGSSELIFWYAQKIASITESAPAHKSILILGGGAFSLPQYFAEKYPDTHITVVEIDPKLESIAKEYFYYETKPNVTAIGEDARSFLEKNTAKYDLIVVDAFSDTSVPFSLTTKEYTKALARATHASSVVMVNYITSHHPACKPLHSGMNASYTLQFEHSAYFFRYRDNTYIRQNMIAVYSNSKLAWLGEKSDQLVLDNTQAFSDNFAPTERLHFSCITQG